MKKILIVIYIILILVIIKLISAFAINEIFISKYDDGKYNSKDVRGLFFLNVFEQYTAHYNHGNVLYHNSDFDEAIEEYEKALAMSPPKDKERDIKINLELAKKAKEEKEDNKSNNQEEQEKEEVEKDPKQSEQSKEQEVEKKLKEIQKEANNERQDGLESMQRLDESYEYYSGKRW